MTEITGSRKGEGQLCLHGFPLFILSRVLECLSALPVYNVLWAVKIGNRSQGQTKPRGFQINVQESNRRRCALTV